jgi:acetyl-CoA C-acetyltransferase
VKDVVIISAVRTAIGKFQGSLQSFSAPQLGALVVREALRRADFYSIATDASNEDKAVSRLAEVNECIMGCVLQAGLGQAPARQAAIYAGLPPEVSALTINQVCGSGLRAVGLAAQSIQTGDAEIVVAGGMESMTSAPYLLPQARSGYRMGDGKLVDSMICDGLWDPYNDFHMGAAAEMVAEKYAITREQQDAFATESHSRAAAATAQGVFRDEIVPV